LGKIISLNTSLQKGERKKKVDAAYLLKGQGIKGDAHAGFAHRQVSLLDLESIKKIQAKGLDVGPGDFAENLTTEGLDLIRLPIGTRLRAGTEVILRVTQIGKECHSRCAIYEQAGECVMPTEGIFAEVLRGGPLNIGDSLRIYPSYRFAVITASDKGSQGLREDQSGPLAAEMLQPWGDVIDQRIVPDEQEELAQQLRQLADQGQVDLILTTGGTGLSPRDITPEATLQVIDREVPGIPEAMRRESGKITAKAMLSRAIAGIRGKTLIINLPGSPKGVRENLEVVLPVLDHALEILTGRGGECGSDH